MQIIPFKNYSSFDMELTLDGVPYIIKFNWNSRYEFWTISFYDREKTVLVTGIKIVINYELLTQLVDKGLPPGQLYAIRENESHDRLTKDEFFNNDAFLIYVSEDEIDSL